MIKIIEKEPYKNFDNWNNRECLMYPTMMIKDGKEHFIFNRREPDAEYQEKENQDIFDRRMTNEESIDFHGNRENYSSAFMYRIYDKKLENALKEIVEYINKKEWEIAEGVLIENEQPFKNFNAKKDITQGLDYNDFMKLVDSKVESVKDCLNYDTFKADIEVLKNANLGCGLSAITSNNWLKDICNLSEIELKTYVDNYKLGLLNPYNQEEEELET